MQNLMLINLFTHQKQIPEVENEFTVTRVGKVKEVIDREFGIDMYILLLIYIMTCMFIHFEKHPFAPCTSSSLKNLL